MSTPKPKRGVQQRYKQRRVTGWERKCDGTKWARSDLERARERAKRLGPTSQQDIDSISRMIRRTSLTTVDDHGVIRGEVALAIVEDRRWSEV